MGLLETFLNALRAGANGKFISVSWDLPTFYTKPKEEAKPMAHEWIYFKSEEVEGLQDEFVAKLDMARKIAGIPFVITSGFRSVEKNESVIGAVPESAHTKGLAVDLKVDNSHEVSLILDAAKAAGITRRGVYVDVWWEPIHVHLDDDPGKIQEVVFIRQEGKKAA